MREIPGALSEKFQALQADYTEFYRIRNHPSDGIEFEDWKRLKKKDREAWAQRLNAQAEKVRTGIKELAELKAYRPYHELQSFFREDARALEGLIGKYGFKIEKLVI